MTSKRTTRWILAGVAGILIGACAAESDPADMAEERCLAAAECMVNDCADELRDFQDCVDSTGDASVCDELAVGRCADECRDPETPKEERDASFALFLCETDDEQDDCSEAAAACSP